MIGANGRCRNLRCAEKLNIWSGDILCPACRYLSRRVFVLTCALVGLVWGVIKITIKVVGWFW